MGASGSAYKQFYTAKHQHSDAKGQTQANHNEFEGFPDGDGCSKAQSIVTRNRDQVGRISIWHKDSFGRVLRPDKWHTFAEMETRHERYGQVNVTEVKLVVMMVHKRVTDAESSAPAEVRLWSQGVKGVSQQSYSACTVLQALCVCVLHHLWPGQSPRISCQ